MELYVSKTLPPYIQSNISCYKKMVETFYSEIAKAHSKEEYESIMSKLCRRYMDNFTNEDVQRYLLESGEMDEEDMALIRKFYVDHAEPFQKAFLSAGMKEGKRYTLVYMNDTGFPVMDQITFISVSPCQFAQYTDSVRIHFKRAKGRREIKKYFYPLSIAIYEGWHDLKKRGLYG